MRRTVRGFAKPVKKAGQVSVRLAVVVAFACLLMPVSGATALAGGCPLTEHLSYKFGATWPTDIVKNNIRLHTVRDSNQHAIMIGASGNSYAVMVYRGNLQSALSSGLAAAGFPISGLLRPKRISVTGGSCAMSTSTKDRSLTFTAPVRASAGYIEVQGNTPENGTVRIQRRASSQSPWRTLAKARSQGVGYAIDYDKRIKITSTGQYRAYWPKQCSDYWCATAKTPPVTISVTG